ncbi:TPA: TIGR00269 family protein [Candidatus Woesearchaeota archaeon]|nr:TIGR00269 family protein [Candidatus Woesearchaeota archaeon]
MNCIHCSEKAVIELQHGALCKNHFLSHFEDRVFTTINRYKMLGPDDLICVATSGGKDSLTVLYLTQKYIKKHKYKNAAVFALAVDEGIENYREKTLQDLTKFCTEHNVPLTIVKSKDTFNKTLDETYQTITEKKNKKPCHVCGVWRRYLLNKTAKEMGATKIVTGHNLDDEAQAIMMNIFKANTSLAGRLGPVSGIKENEHFTSRVKPLYLCPEKEVRLYALLKGFQVHFAECPYSKEGYRHHIQEMLNNFEEQYKGTKQGIVRSFLAILPLLKEAQKEEKIINTCTLCGEATSKEICNACAMKEELMT